MLEPELDRFQYVEPKEPSEYSTCAGCGEVIYEGEEILDVYGMSVHSDFQCLKRAVEARYLIAGCDEE